MKPQGFIYEDRRSQKALQYLKLAYAVQIFKILDDVAEESCIHQSSYATRKWPRSAGFLASWHNRSRTWVVKIKRYGRKAFAQVKERQLMKHWAAYLGHYLVPPSHPSEFPELQCTVFRWNEVIDEQFIRDVLQKIHPLCPPPNPYQWWTPDFVSYKPPVIVLDADSDTELLSESDESSCDAN